jgi:hypothetical protein
MHNPHPDTTLYDALIKRFRKYSYFWGLAPEQKNVKF